MSHPLSRQRAAHEADHSSTTRRGKKGVKPQTARQAKPYEQLVPLHLETLRSSPSSSLLELPALALDVWLLVLVRTHAEVLDCLSCVLGAAQQNDVAAGWVLHGQLIQGETLTAGLLDPGARSGGESEGCDVQLGDLEHAVVVGHGANYGDGLVGVGLLCTLARHFAGDAGDGHGRAVDAGHEEALEHDSVERSVGSAWFFWELSEISHSTPSQS